MTQTERDELRQLWAGLVVEFRASGLGQAEWCRQNGYKVRHLQYWVHKLPAPDAPASDPVDWLSVPVASGLDTEAPLVVRVGSARIDVRPGFAPDLLRSVVQALS